MAYTSEQAQQIVELILEQLGDGETNTQKKALQAFMDKDYEKVKNLSAINLADNFCKSLGYLGGVLKLTPNTATIAAEAARSAAEYKKERTLAQLSSNLENILLLAEHAPSK